MEIYTNALPAERTVFLEFPVMTGSEVDCFAYVDGEQVFEFTSLTVAPTGDGYIATLPLFLIQFDSEVKIYWTVTYTDPADNQVYSVTKITQVNIVTPILSRRDIRAIDNVVFATDAECIKIEKAVRHIIQAYTGQEFGHFHGTQLVKGSKSSALFVPRRIVELETVNGINANLNYMVDPEGYVIRHYPYGVPPVKADAYGLHMHVGGVIHNPNNVHVGEFSGQAYLLAGRFGWEEVPAAVKEAAKLLVNDYACADSQYRDRYLTSMTAADWRIQFNSAAFQRTGNVRADQLLSDFVVTRGWGVI